MAKRLQLDDLRPRMLIMVMDVTLASQAPVPEFLGSHFDDYFRSHAQVQYEWGLRGLIGKPLQIVAVDLPFLAVKRVRPEESGGGFMNIMVGPSPDVFSINATEVLLASVASGYVQAYRGGPAKKQPRKKRSRSNQCNCQEQGDDAEAAS